MPAHCRGLIKEKQNFMVWGLTVYGIIFVEMSSGQDKISGIFHLCFVEFLFFEA